MSKPSAEPWPDRELHLRFEAANSGPRLRVRLEGLGQVAWAEDLDADRLVRDVQACCQAQREARVPAEDPRAVHQHLTRALGQRLAAAIAPAPLRTLWAQAYAHGHRRMGRLNLHFLPDDPRQWGLLTLPWEALYDEALGGFLDDWLMIVRRVPATGAPKATLTPSDPPLRVLAAFANPPDSPPLNLRAERRALARAAQDPLARRLDMRAVGPPASISAVEGALLHFDARVFHFGGHGPQPREGQEGVTVTLDTPEGRSQAVSGAALGARLTGRGVALAVLNGCDTLGTASVRSARGLQPMLDLLSNGLSAVVATQAEIDDAAAPAFAEELYRQLAEGHSVAHATWAGRRVWRHRDIAHAGWTAPALILAHDDGPLLPPRERAWWAHWATFVALLTLEALLVVCAFTRWTETGWHRAPWWDLAPPLVALGLLLPWRGRQQRALRAHGVLPELQRLASCLSILACAASAALVVHVLVSWR
jgi:hypothetical protein